MHRRVRGPQSALRALDLSVGVLSNTLWPRTWHREIFERDGVLDLIDAQVYSSELPWTKPHPRAFAEIMRRPYRVLCRGRPLSAITALVWAR